MGVADHFNADLPTLQQMDAERAGLPIKKGKTRLEETTADLAQAKIDEKKFKAKVWFRDRNRCRCCGRKVIKTLSRVPDRGEVNHIHGRTGALRLEIRAALLMCLTCHERFTGKVNAHRLRIISSKTFTIPQGTFTDATHPITFEEAGHGETEFDRESHRGARSRARRHHARDREAPETVAS